MVIVKLPAAAPVVTIGVLLCSGQTPSLDERLASHRNLGKAFYENPTTHKESVAEFRKALDLAPNSAREKLNYGLALLRAGNVSEGVKLLQAVQKQDATLPHTWFNLGIAYKKSGEVPQAIEQFERLIKLTPDEPIAQYQLGTLYKLTGRNLDALGRFELAAKLDPRLAAARFQLYNLYRQAGRTEDGARSLEAFSELKRQAEGAVIPEDVDWCVLAEIYDPPMTAALGTGSTAATFEDRTLDGAVDPKTSGMVAIDTTASGQTDLIVWSSRGINLYKRGNELVRDAGLANLTGVVHVAPGDFDNDGWMDLCIVTESAALLYRNVKGRFQLHDTQPPVRGFQRAVWIDYDHDNDLDLLLLGDAPALMRNQGTAGFADRTGDFPFVPGAVTDAFKLRTEPDSKAFDLAVVYRDRAPVLYNDRLGGRYETASFDGKARDLKVSAADFNNDGRLDGARIVEDGRVHVLRNATGSPSRWIRVQLTGIKSLKLAEDAEVEIKAGKQYEKQVYRGVPLVFDLGSHGVVDVVRITWPNGLIQNEVRQATNRLYIYKEAQRLSGSCPMIWTWNGRRFQFITDVLGVAPLGASDGEGTYFPVDHDEFVQIPASALAAVNGQYEIRITEELSEVSYLDQIRLYTLDHPADTEIFTNDKFKSPPFPDFRLFGVKRRVYPKTARDQGGRDVRKELLTQDHRYPDGFARAQSGVSELHSLDLDFGPGAAPDGHAVLLLNGWVDWADGSTFRGAAQEYKGGLVFPYLQMRDPNGAWRTVVEDMGMPSGKPKTIAIELKFPSASREVRILTNLCVYWDEIFLSEGESSPAVHQSVVPLQSADLHFRGFSGASIDPERKQPEAFFYDRVANTSSWNPTPGLYTRYGDVRDIVDEVDDRLAIMGSGDELRLLFRVDSPPPPAGWKRDFLLKVDGWAKDRDPNTAFSTSVEPLPFHGMSRYPYPSNERYPSDPAHESYRREYNTRPALRLIRPLSGRNQ